MKYSAALLLTACLTAVPAHAQFRIYEQDDSRVWMEPDLAVSDLTCADILPLLSQAQRDITERGITHPDLPLATELTDRAAQRFAAAPNDGICQQDGIEALQLFRGMVGLY